MNSALLLSSVFCLVAILIAIIIYFVVTKPTDVPKLQNIPKVQPKLIVEPSNLEKCNNEKLAYVADNRPWLTKNGTDAWDQYINYGKDAGEVWKGTGCPSLYPNAVAKVTIVDPNIQKCNDEKLVYAQNKPWLPSEPINDAWKHYVKYGEFDKQTWSGPGCPNLYPTAIKEEITQRCNDEKLVYAKDKPWLPSQPINDAWKHYVKYGEFAKQTWSGPGCPNLYPTAIKEEITQRCTDEKASYAKDHSGAGWDEYVKYGIGMGQTWSGPGCPAMYPGQEQAQLDLIKK